MTPYEGDGRDVPAPIARVILTNPVTNTTVRDVPMLIDSGADVTLLPIEAIQMLDIPIEDELYELCGFDGSHSTARSVQAVMKLENLSFNGKYLVDPGEIGVLGRNVLNSVVLELNGPELRWSMRGA